LDGVYKGGNSPFDKKVTVSENSSFKMESRENNLQIPPKDCEPDAPYKMEFAKADIYFESISIKVPCLGIDFVTPSIKVPAIEIDSFISCFKDLHIDYYGIIYVSVRLLIAAIPMLITYHPV